MRHITSWGQQRRQQLSRWVLTGLLLAPLALLAQPAGQTVRLVVGYAPGGPVDAAARLFAPALARELGQNVVVENKPGAGGAMGGDMVAKAAPNGLLLFFAASPTMTISPHILKAMAFDTAKDVTPIAPLVSYTNVLVVNKDQPFKTVPELVAYAKANPDKLSYASQGNGSTAHLTAELFKQKTGTKLVHVPYKGDAPAMADLLAGHVNVMFGNVAQASAHLRSGKLKVLAVTSAKRITSMPNIPAMQEVVPGVVAVAWFAMVAPPKTPAAIVNRLSSLIGEILRTPEMARRFAEVGAEPVGNTPEEMAQWMKEDTERWRQVIKTGGVTID